MKSTIYYLMFLIFILSCTDNKSNISETKNSETAKEESKENTLEGNWEMVGFYNYKDNKVIDSFYTNKGYRQVKMYNKNKVMWSKLVPKDSIEWFGYGSYTATDSTLTEVMQYGSSVMNKVIAEQKEFSYKLEIEENSFRQIQIDEDGNMLYSENYKRIE